MNLDKTSNLQKFAKLNILLYRKLLTAIAGFIQVQLFLPSLFMDFVKSDHLYVVWQTNDSNNTRLCLTANTCSMHGLPCLNTHCSSPIAQSVPALTLLMSTLPNRLLTTLNKLIPLELLHSHLSPFPLYRGTIQAPRQSIYRYHPHIKT